MKKIVLKISGMTCSACSSGLEKYLSHQEGIKSASVNLVLSLATIEYEDIKLEVIEKYIEDAGFKSLGEFRNISDLESKNSDKIKLIIFGILIILLMYISMYHMFNLPSLFMVNYDNPVILATTMLFITMAFLYFGYDILKMGIKNLIHRIPNMDTLVMFSVIFSFLYSLYGYIQIIMGDTSFLHNLYFESACMIIYFIKLGRFIEASSKDKTKNALKELVQITPDYAILKRNNETIKVTIDEVKIGDILVSKVGEKIAVDGIVTNGKTYVDESFITGESAPVLKSVGNKVIAGSILYDGYIEYKAERIGKKSTISEIIEIVINSTNSKTKIQRLADKISGYFVPIVLIIASINFLIQLISGLPFSDALTHFVTIMVVACPCALGLSVPLVVVVSNGLCAKKGLFLRNSEVIENMQKINTIVFDKTGTLTYGKLNVYKMFNYSDLTNEEILNIVSSIEALSNHPISTAFQGGNLKVNNFKVLPGEGITGSIAGKKYYLGNKNMLSNLKIKVNDNKDFDYLTNNACSIIYVVQNKKILALIGVRDTIRKNIKEVIKEFTSNGIEIIMLTGDNKVTANIVAKEIGITNIIADVLPQDKAKHIDDLIKEGRSVVMVGDGINDAPALVKSTIGISINDGTDIAADSSDVILMNNDISNILDLIKISKRAMRKIKQNLFWAFIYNICMIPIAAGLLSGIGINMNPMFASIAMTLSSLTVVLNSWILGRMKI